MKKILIAVVFTTLGFAAMAQKQKMDKIITLYYQQNWEQAKTEVDQLIAVPQNTSDPQVLITKLDIYSEIAFDSAFKIKYPGAREEAYNTLLKYIEKEPSLAMLKDTIKGNVNHLRGVSILYTIYFSNGRQLFKEQKWQEALDQFKITENIGDIISKHDLGTTKQKIDTFAVLYAGYSAYNAKKHEEAMYYYTKFANEKIGGVDYIDLYRYLLDYYVKNKAEADFNKYLAIAKELYPNEKNKYWDVYEMEYKTKNTGVEQVIDAYKKANAEGTTTAEQYAEYGNYFFDIVKKSNKMDSVLLETVNASAVDAYKKAFEKETEDTIKGVYAFNVGLILYKKYDALEEEYFNSKGMDAALKAKRAEIEKKQDVVADEIIKIIEKSYTIFKNKGTLNRVEKQCLSMSAKYLANIYLWKRDKSKVKAPQDYDKYDAKYKEYDANM